MSEILSKLLSCLFIAPGMLIAIIVHECAHGWVSDKLGDPTPRASGRLSLNPIKHLDPVGALCLLIFQVGWAKPVPINTAYYKNRKKGLIATSLAGPVSNFIMAFIFTLVYGVIVKTGLYANTVGTVALDLCYCAILINIGLGLFNLIPLPPLDGSNVVAALSSKVAGFYRKYYQYTRIVLIVLLITGVLSTPLVYVRNTIVDGMCSVVELILRL